MKDIPMFTTEYGGASLMLREIPYRQEAYIRIQAVQPGSLRDLLAECSSFCRMVGAEKIYAADYEGLAEFPLHTSIYQMRGTAWVDPQLMENLFPVTDTTVSQWRQLYNERMKGVDCAATQTAFDERNIVDSGGAYFVHRTGELLGIGWMKGQQLLAVCSKVPGAGERVMHTLMSLIEGVEMELEVASTNEKAIRLYQKLGFIQTRELTVWRRVFPEK